MYLLAFNWPSFLANLGQFILSFSILVVLHELGHFLTARWFGCRVEKFYLFFNPWFSIAKKQVGETEYGLGWVPFGGYVKISGMIDESMDKEQMKLPPQPHEFRAKPAWQRLIIMIAGVVVNFILALIIFAMVLYKWGEQKLPVQSLTYGLAADSLAYAAGLRDGDIITEVSGKPQVYLNSLEKDIMLSDKAVLKVRRNNTDTTIQLPDGFITKLTKSQFSGFVSPRMPIVVDSVSTSIAYTSNQKLVKGDKIIAVNSVPVQFMHELEKVKRQNINKQIALTVLRNQQDTTLVNVKINPEANIGFVQAPASKIFNFEYKEYGFIESIPAGVNYGINRLQDYIQGIRLMFTSKERKVQDNLGSVISIGKTFGGEWDWKRFWIMTGLFSIILAFMNILPIPALDGGHALFCIIEMITRRKPSDKFMEYAQMTGMILMMGLMVWALGLDIFRLFK